LDAKLHEVWQSERLTAFMFTVIYSFKVKPGKNSQFEKAWHDLTELIYEFEGSIGSRLHQLENNRDYIAHAQWPSKEKWQNSGDYLPAISKEHSAAMHAACVDIQTVYQMDVIVDLLQTKMKNS